MSSRLNGQDPGAEGRKAKFHLRRAGQQTSSSPRPGFQAGDWDEEKVTVYDGKNFAVYPSLIAWIQAVQTPTDLYIEKQSFESYKPELRPEVMAAAQEAGHRLRGLNSHYTFKGRKGREKTTDARDAKAIYQRVLDGAYGRFLKAEIDVERREWYKTLDREIILARPAGLTKPTYKKATALLRSEWGPERRWPELTRKCLSGVTLRATLYWIAQYAKSRDEWDRLISLQEHGHHGIIRSNLIYHKYRRIKKKVPRTDFRRVLRSAYSVLREGGEARSHLREQANGHLPSPRRTQKEPVNA